MTGGAERFSIYEKLMNSYKAVGGGRMDIDELPIRRMRELGVRVVNQIEKDMSLNYDHMPDQATFQEWSERMNLQEREMMAGLDRLIMSGFLEVSDGLVKKKVRYLGEVLEDIEDQIHRKMLRQRLEGMSLHEIGDANDLTRERVRQILAKIFARIPVTHVIESRRRKYLYQSYILDSRFFEEVLSEKRAVYHFLSDKLDKGSLDKKGAYAILHPEEKKRLLECEELFENASGLAVPLSKNGLVEKYFSVAGRETKHVTIHHRQYLCFLEEELRGREEALEAYTLTERNFESLANRIVGCLQSGNKKIRYFDLDLVLEEEDEIRELLRMKESVYNTRLVFNRNEAYFHALDIRDHHELHNIMRDNLRLDFVDMRRIPEYSIDVEGKLEWLVHLIDEMGPVHLEKFIVRLEEDYGLHAPSTRSLIQMELSDYITPQNHLVHDLPELPPDELRFIKDQLVEDIYVVKELVTRNVHIKKNQHDYLNNRNLNSIGYSLSGGFVVRKEFGSGEKYFRHRLLEEDYFKRDSSAVQNTQSFWKVLNDLQSSFDLFRIEEDLYMNISVLEKAGIGKEELKDFRKMVVRHFVNRRYYTVKNIHSELSHPVLDFGFDDIFYERICRTDERVRFIPSSSGDLLYQGYGRRNQTDFLRHEIEDGINLESFLQKIDKKYGITLEATKVIEKVREAGMHYTTEMDRIYVDKESFLDAVYEG